MFLSLLNEIIIIINSSPPKKKRKEKKKKNERKKNKNIKQIKFQLVILYYLQFPCTYIKIHLKKYIYNIHREKFNLIASYKKKKKKKNKSRSIQIIGIIAKLFLGLKNNIPVVFFHVGRFSADILWLEARNSSWSDFQPFGCFIVLADRPYTFVILRSAIASLARTFNTLGSSPGTSSA